MFTKVASSLADTGAAAQVRALKATMSPEEWAALSAKNVAEGHAIAEAKKKSVWSLSNAWSETKRAVSNPLGAVKEAAKTTQTRTRTTVEALHTGALADIANLTGSQGLLRNPKQWATNVAGGIKTDLASGARVMGQFASGKWGALASEAALDLGTVANVDKGTLTKLSQSAGKAGEEYGKAKAAYDSGGTAGLAQYGAEKAGVPPEVAALGAGAVAAYQQGGPAAVQQWAETTGKDEIKARTGIDPDQLAALGQNTLDQIEQAGAGMQIPNIGGALNSAAAFTSGATARVGQASATLGNLGAAARGTLTSAVGNLAGVQSQIQAAMRPPTAVSHEAAAIATMANQQTQQAQPVAEKVGHLAGKVPTWGWVAGGVAVLLFLLMRR
jgi:hypothetical protein